MKKYCIAVIAIILGLSSCKKVEQPSSADFAWYLKEDYEANILDLSKANANPSSVELSDVLYFVAKSNDASSYVVWTGDPGHNYLERDLTAEQKNDTVNNAYLRAAGLALSSKNALGMFYKTYNFTEISEVGKPFQIYCTARNYDYELDDYEEICAGPFEINVIDTQTDLWDKADPYNSGGAKNYSMTFKFGTKRVTKDTKGEKGSYEIIGETAGTKPGIKVTYPKGASPVNANVVFKVKSCIPFSTSGTISYNVKNKTYTWVVDLSTPQTLVLASQSAVEPGYANYLKLTENDEGVEGNSVSCTDANNFSKIAKPEYSKEYEFSAVEYVAE